MDAVDAAGAVLVDLVDGVFDTGLLEVFLLLCSTGIEGLLLEGIGEDPVLGDDLTQSTGHNASIAGKRHVDGSSLVQNGHDTHIHGHPDTGSADGIQPPAELVHIPAQLRHDVVSAIILLLLQESDISVDAAAGNVAFGRACDSDGEFVAKLLADELDQLGSIVKVAASTGPTEGQVAPQASIWSIP